MPRKKKSGESQISFPPRIHQLALDFCRERLKKEESKRQSQLKQAKERKRTRAFRLQHGLEDAKKIFTWAKAFRNHEIGQELIRKSCGRMFFFDGNIEGVEWVGLAVTNKDLFWIFRGKGCSPHIVKSAFDLAVDEELDLKILKAAREWIKNGKVWECIERRFDCLKE